MEGEGVRGGDLWGNGSIEFMNIGGSWLARGCMCREGVPEQGELETPLLRPLTGRRVLGGTLLGF